MRITSKGQVTIPIDLREKQGLLPDTEVEFEERQDGVLIRRARKPKQETRAESVIRRMRGSATVKMSTEEMMRLMRGDR